MEISLPITLTALFLSVALLTGALVNAGFEHASPVRRRLRGLRRTPSGTRVDGKASAIGDSPMTDPLVKRVMTFVPKSPKEMSKVQRRLAMAGLHQPRHVAIYLLAEVALPALGFASLFLALGLSGLVYAALAAVVGYLIPGLIVSRRVRQRQKQIMNGLPDALDLLIISLEAGLAIDGAILKSAEELRIAYPALAEELHLITVECRAGKPRLDAFKNFAKRTQVDDVRALVAMLVQTDRFGTSIADALRTYAEVSRTKRRQRAEERAAKIGVKLVFPLVFCLFPAFFVVTMGAGVIKLIRAFSSSGAIGSNPVFGG
jgi:tight adherence protein C